MKFLLCNDLHLDDRKPAKRIDDFPTTQLKKFKQMLDEAAKAKCKAILCAGDMFNRPNVSKKLISTLQSLLYINGIPVYVVPGQHDLLFRNYENIDDTALGVLASSRLVTIVSPDVKVGLGENCFLYGCGWGEAIPVPDHDQHCTNILITHYSVGVEKLFSGMSLKFAEDFLKEHSKYDLILCGDYHFPFQCAVKNKRTQKIRQIVNCGALLRRNIDERSIVPKVGIYDTTTRKVSYKRIQSAPSVFPNEEETRDTVLPMVDEVLDNLKGAKTLGTDYKESILKYLTSQKSVSQEIVKKVSELLNEAEEVTNAKG